MAHVNRVLIIEEIRSRRERIAELIQSLAGFQLFGQASGTEEALAVAANIKPNVIILDAELPEMAEGKPIAKYASVAPEAIVICTRDEWTEAAAMLVLRAGAKGYLTKNFNADDFLEAVAAATAANDEIAGKIITLFSAKAGCGKTTLAANLAVGLAQQTELKIGVVDANLSFGDLAVYYNIHPKTTIIEAARDVQYLSPANLGAYLTSYDGFLRLLASPSKPEKAELVHSGDLTAILAMMKHAFRYVIVDTGSGFNEISLASCDAADTVYIISALNTGLELEHVRQALNTFHSLGYEDSKIKVVISRVPNRDIDCLKRLEDQLTHPVSALLPNDFRLAASAANKGKPLLLTKPASALAKGIMDVVRDVGLGDIAATKQIVNKNPFYRLLGRG